jgi:hypothetical protein
VAPDIVAQYDLNRLIKYLRESPVVATASRMNFPCAMTGVRTTGSISFRTDGEWVWLDDLPDYVEKHRVAIPTKWYHKIEASHFTPAPAVDQSVIAGLEFPPVGG